MTEQENGSRGLLVDSSDHHKIAQAFYHAVTGKTEKLSRSFTENYCVRFADIEQLNAKCKQMCAQWHVLESNTNITINHLDDNTQNFSSVERLKIYDQSQTSPVEGITIDFNILLSLPGVEKPQPYKITVRVLSAVALMRRIEEDMPPPSFLKWFRGGPIVVDIEYVDYVVARNILSTMESWVNEVQISAKGKALRFAQRNSIWAPRVGGAILLLVAAMASFWSAGEVLQVDSGDQVLAQFLIATFAFVAGSMYLGTWVGRFAENAIDRLQELSYIAFNRGDERLIDRFRRKNRNSLVIAVTSFVVITIHAVSINLIASYIYAYFAS